LSDLVELGRWVELGGLEPRARWSARLLAFAVLVVAAVLVLVSRLFQLQVEDGHHLAALAQQSRVHRVVLRANRGIIYDRHGQQLVINSPAWTLELIPYELPVAEGQRNAELAWVAQVAGKSASSLEQAVARSDGLTPIVVQRNLPDQEAEVLTERQPQLPGVSLQQVPLRDYLDSVLLSHVLGYTGPINAQQYAQLASQGYQPDENIGQAGIEQSLESTLRGQDGWADTLFDAQGQPVKVLNSKPAVNGDNVYLSIDLGLQQAAYNYLAAEIKKVKVVAGAALVVDPRDGEVLALDSYPGYDTNLFTAGITNAQYQQLLNAPGNPLYDHAVQGEYPPGSTFKPIVASAALQEGVITADTMLNCPLGLSFGGWFYHNWAGYDMGLMNVDRAIAESCDTFFYQVANMLGPGPMAKYAEAFGYGTAPGIELPDVSAGLAPTPAWKQSVCNGPPSSWQCQWSLGETILYGIGQADVLTTPLIQAMYISAVANGGDLLRPTLVHEIDTPAGKTVSTVQPDVVRHVPVSPENLTTVREGMHMCLDDPRGTGYWFRDAKFSYDGGCKTGTAQYGSGANQPTHAWFVFFSPYNNPQIVIVVFVEGGGEGDQVAEPVALQIAQYYYAHQAQIQSGVSK
jgi:penicillin-binding protein 2